jgi:hypothetical protein
LITTFLEQDEPWKMSCLGVRKCSENDVVTWHPSAFGGTRVSLWRWTHRRGQTKDIGNISCTSRTISRQCASSLTSSEKLDQLLTRDVRQTTSVNRGQSTGHIWSHIVKPEKVH